MGMNIHIIDSLNFGIKRYIIDLEEYKRRKTECDADSPDAAGPERKCRKEQDDGGCTVHLQRNRIDTAPLGPAH